MRQRLNSAVIDGNKRHIVLFGKNGSGKTSIFLQLTGAMSAGMGAAKFDPVVGICRLGRAGDAIMIDTAGLNSTAELHDENVRRTLNLVRRADIAIYVINVQEFDRRAYARDHAWLERSRIPYLLVFNHCDEAYAGDIARLKTEFHDAVFISSQTPGSVSLLRTRLTQMGRERNRLEPPLIPQGLVKPGDYVLMLAMGSGGASPKEHEMITALLRCGARCVVTELRDLKNVLEELPRVDLVIAYARLFDQVRSLVPESVPLTSYSLLYSLQTGVLDTAIAGANVISSLTPQSRVLIAEGCKNGCWHRDIGRVKIPRALRKAVGEGLHIDYASGLDLPENIDSYDLVIHCAGCAMTQRAVQARVEICREAGVPAANYGTVLAELSGLLPRCAQVLGAEMP